MLLSQVLFAVLAGLSRRLKIRTEDCKNFQPCLLQTGWFSYQATVGRRPQRCLDGNIKGKRLPLFIRNPWPCWLLSSVSPNTALFMPQFSACYLFIWTTEYQFTKKLDVSICNGDFDLDSWFNTDGCDLLNSQSQKDCRSVSRLRSLMGKRSQVPEPSPRGVFLVVILRVLVGTRTGPFTFEILLRAADQVSTHRLHGLDIAAGDCDPNPWIATSGCPGVLPGPFKATAAARLPDRLVPRRRRQRQRWARRSRSGRRLLQGSLCCMQLSAHRGYDPYGQGHMVGSR